MAAYGVKKCHRITEKDPLTLQEPVPYMNTIIIKKNGTDCHISQIAYQTSSTPAFTHAGYKLRQE